MSDLTRGNLVFGSLNSKRSRVSLARRGEAGTAQGGWPQRGKRMTRRSSPRGNDEVACVLCGPWSQRGAREEGGRRTNDSGSLIARWGLGDEKGVPESGRGEWDGWGIAGGREVEGVRSPEAAGCLLFTWPAPRGNLASARRR